MSDNIGTCFRCGKHLTNPHVCSVLLSAEQKEQIENIVKQQSAIEQQSQRIKELKTKLAEQQAYIMKLKDAVFHFRHPANMGGREGVLNASINLSKMLDEKPDTEELTCLLHEAEQRGAVQALRRAADLFFNNDWYRLPCGEKHIGKDGVRKELRRMADELEGRKL